MTGDDSGLGSGDGKYELLSVANDLIAEEVRRLMARSESSASATGSNNCSISEYGGAASPDVLYFHFAAKISGHQTDTMLAGSLAKALCCIPLC